jgi:hypothetical protein
MCAGFGTVYEVESKRAGQRLQTEKQLWIDDGLLYKPPHPIHSTSSKTLHHTAGSGKFVHDRAIVFERNPVKPMIVTGSVSDLLMQAISFV